MNMEFNLSGGSYFRDSGLKYKPQGQNSEYLNKVSNSNFNSPSKYKIPDYSSGDIIQYSNRVLQPQDWENMAKLLANNSNISVMDLSGINITDFGLRYLSDIIKANPQLRTLKLQWDYLNEFSKEFDYLCEGISRSGITHLYLDNNKINSKLSSSISKMIQNSNSLLYIDLRWNEIGNDGAKEIVSSLLRNNIIQELNLNGNKISDECLREINEHLRKNKTYAHSTFLNATYSEGGALGNNSLKQYTTVINREQSPIISELSPSQLVDNNNQLQVKFLEKEREISEEFKARYDVQLIANSKLEKRVRELELLLESERGKIQQAKEAFDKELKIEQEYRIKYEQQVLDLKQKVAELNVENERNVSKLNLIIQGNVQENENLKYEKKTMQETHQRNILHFEERFNLKENEYENNYSLLREKVEMLKNEIEQIKRENNEENKLIMREFEKKYKTLEENFKILKIQKDELGLKNIQFKKEALDLKMTLEIEARKRENDLLSEERIKFEGMLKGLENKYKVMEEHNKELKDKYNNIINDLNATKKAAVEDQILLENKLNQLNMENINLQKLNSGLSSEISKLSSDANIKETLLIKFKSQIDDLSRKIEDISKMNSISIEKLNDERLVEKKNWEIEKKLLNVKVEETEKMIEKLKLRIAKNETDNVKFSENLKSSVIKLIDDNF
jgi:hypothetical protein